MNISELYPNSPTPNLPVDSWDFDPGYDLTMHGEENMILFGEFNLIFNPASIVCGLAVIFIVLILRSYDAKLVDRVSLRLTVVISAVDVFKAAAYLLFTYIATPGIWCGFTSWLILFSTTYYTFLSVAIAFNLQWVFLLKKPVYKWLEVFYFVASFLLALATSVPAWAAGRLGYDPNYGVCWYISYSTKRTILWEWLTFLSWNLLGTLYCFFVVIFVVIHLKASSRKLASFKHNKHTASHVSEVNNRDRKTQQTLNKLVTRVSLYALIPIITQGGWYLNELYFQFGHTMNYAFNFWCIVGTDLPGVFNLIAFCMDPALANSLSYIKRDAIERYGTDSARLGLQGKVTTKTRFMCWFTRTFLGEKKVDKGDSFHRMSSAYVSSTEPAKRGISVSHVVTFAEHDEEKSYSQYSDNEDDYTNEEALPMSNIVQNSSVPDAGVTISVNARRRKKSVDETIKQLFRGL